MIKNILVACLLVASALCTGCATGDINTARGAVIADNVVSQAVISSGAGMEAGLGWWTLPIRFAALEYAKTQPPEKAQETIDGVTASGHIGLASGVAIALTHSNPIGLAAMAVTGLLSWQAGAPKREFLNACAVHKRVVPEAARLTCEFKS